jgi:hypothetical protein
MKFLSLFVGTAVGALAVGTAFAAGYERLPDDEPTTINGVDVACTGVGDEAKENPRWQDYSVRLEFAWGERQYLADLDVTLATADGHEFLSVRCGGPWLLVNLVPGKYRVRAEFEHHLVKTTTFMAPAHGQKRVVVAFPEVVGD